MFCWNCSRHYYWRKIEAISIVLADDYRVLEFLFEKKRPRLRLAAEVLLKDAVCLSRAEQVLVRVSLDIWSGSGNATITEAFEHLSQERFSNVLLGIQYLGIKQVDGGTWTFAN